MQNIRLSSQESLKFLQGEGLSHSGYNLQRTEFPNGVKQEDIVMEPHSMTSKLLHY